MFLLVAASTNSFTVKPESANTEQIQNKIQKKAKKGLFRMDKKKLMLIQDKQNLACWKQR